MITKEELCKEYRKWLIEEYARVGDFENADYIRVMDNAEPSLCDGECGNYREDGCFETVFRVNGYSKGVEGEFVFTAIERPIYYENGEIKEYIVVGYEI